MGDFIATTEDPFMKSFYDNYDLRCLVKEPTCFKNSENPSCIDLILINEPQNFIKISVIQTGLSDYHKSSIIACRSYGMFDNKNIVVRNGKIVWKQNIVK